MSYHPYLAVMGISQWQARQSLPGALKRENDIEAEAIEATAQALRTSEEPVERASAELYELVLLVAKRSWQKPAVRVFLEQLTTFAPFVRYEIEDASLSQVGPYWGLGVLQTDVEENLPEAERFIASAPLKKRLWQKLWRWKKTINSL